MYAYGVLTVLTSLTQQQCVSLITDQGKKYDLWKGGEGSWAAILHFLFFFYFFFSACKAIRLHLFAVVLHGHLGGVSSSAGAWVAASSSAGAPASRAEPLPQAPAPPPARDSRADPLRRAPAPTRAGHRRAPSPPARESRADPLLRRAPASRARSPPFHTILPARLFASQYLNLWDRIRNFQLVEGEDSFKWNWSSTGSFSARSAYLALFEGRMDMAGMDLVWDSRAPLRCKFFMWLACWKRCWTAD